MNNYSGVPEIDIKPFDGNRYRKEMILGTSLPAKPKVSILQRVPAVFFALCLCASSLHFLGMHADRCLPASVEEPAAHDHGHEDPGEDHLFLVKKHSSDGFLNNRKFFLRQILSLPSFALPPLLPPPKI
jgi:hypothetical protein